MAERPEDVFTPADPVREDMYASREALEDIVASVLAQPGRQLMLYGDTGVGKTSLAEHLCTKLGHRLVRTEFGPPLDDMLVDAMAQVGARRVLDATDGTERTLAGGAGLPGGVLKSDVSSTTSSSERSAPVSRGLVHQMAELLEEAGVSVLFLDNYEDALKEPTTAAETKAQLSQLIKTLSDRRPEGLRVKLVVAGIPTASEGLIENDPAVERRLAQIEVPRMRDDELETILITGAEKLGMAFHPRARSLIVAYSDGYPYYTHLLALHATKAAIARGSQVVAEVDFQTGLEGAINQCSLELRRLYEQAVETSGTVKVRKSIIEAVALNTAVEIPFSAIRRGFLKLHPGHANSSLNFLNYGIGKLTEEFGVLADRGRPKSPNHKYRFRNPLMRSYVRLLMRREDPQLTLWDPDGEAVDAQTSSSGVNVATTLQGE